MSQIAANFDGIVDVTVSVKAPARLALQMQQILLDSLAQWKEASVGVSAISRDDQHTDQPVSPLFKIAKFVYDRAMERYSLLGTLAEDISWHMLLVLFISEEDESGIKVSNLCRASGGPPTTALRHLNVMEKRGLVIKVPDPADGRQVIVRITQSTKVQMIKLLEAYTDLGA